MVRILSLQYHSPKSGFARKSKIFQLRVERATAYDEISLHVLLEVEPRLSEQGTLPVRIFEAKTVRFFEDAEDGPDVDVDVRAAAVSAVGVADMPRQLVRRSASPFSAQQKWLNEQEGALVVTAD